jgi:hypothetical protein
MFGRRRGRFGGRLEGGSGTQAGVTGHYAHRAEFINAEGRKCRDEEGLSDLALIHCYFKIID